MNSFTRTITPNGFTEKLVYEGKVYEKRYVKDKSGWTGLNKAWDLENLPDDLIWALKGNEELEIMEALARD
ncbi:hypothetical protein EHV15_34660 [Paenibacillus oralis]|uniref:Uncharacterized protein n=1 Tax=Paenibacillus oralis TaxID=2490856 RepID=A0A3P3T9S1_9BACL|nr:hypothetical protein [Paenibacillus oralis]RRJ54740.1 hypothetical protein EHV15_34660 [Paenibacillus oralis]